MATIINQSTLFQRAVTFIVDALQKDPAQPMAKLIDEAAMRFNLSPLESESLSRILADMQTEKTK